MHKSKLSRLDTSNWQILPLHRLHYRAVVALANLVHGEGYLNESMLASMVTQGIVDGKNASFVALADQAVVAYRLSFAAGQWQPDSWCTLSKWPVQTQSMAYFKSVAVKPEYQGNGIGQALLQKSIAVLKQQGAKAGLAHLWCESPNNSAVRYFTKAGGQLLHIHQNRWQHLSAAGYDCPRCRALCCCSAAEMVLLFP